MPEVAVAAGSRLAAEAGAVIASAGGNAVDAAIAAIATSMCTEPGIVNPTAGGYIVIDGAGITPVVIDAYAEMPGRGADPDRFGNGTTVRMGYGGGMETIVGHGSVATPGAWAGLEEAWRRFGRTSWSELLSPAIAAAEAGFPLSTSAAHYLEYSHELVFGWDPPSRTALHTPDGTPLTAGAIVHVPGLADALRQIAAEGTDALYRGDLGTRIVEAVDAGGGLLTKEDLAAYRAIVRDPLTVTVRGARVVTNPAPAVGGAVMAAITLLAERQGFDAWDPGGAASLIRVQRTVLDYRRRQLADPDTVDAAVRHLMDTAELGNLGDLVTSPSTTHTSTVDSEGLACSVTVSSGYGAGALPVGTGFWLNNCLGELELHPAGYHGLAPGTRLVSNMAPTTVTTGHGIVSLGSPGADRITTAVATVLLNHLCLDMPLDVAIDHPRLHVEMFEGRPTVAVEPGIDVGDVEDLTLRRFDDRAMYFGGVAAAMVTDEGAVTAYVDPRRNGAAVVAGHR